MSTSQESPEFDHGGFWDEYSRHWEVKGDGDGVVHDGKMLGDEWSNDPRTRNVLEEFALPHLDETSTVLEIGPGGGKFSRVLREKCGELILADISAGMLERAAAVCRPPVRTVHLDGTGLGPIEDESVDMVFSFDVFIHLESEEVYRYFCEVNRVLRPGGVFVVHTSSIESEYGFLAYLRMIRDHVPQIGTRYGGRMYPMTDDVVRTFFDNAGFDVLRGQSDWESRDLVYAARKRCRAWAWMFLRDGLAHTMELMRRAGGTARRELHGCRLVESDELRTLMVGTASDPQILAAAAAQVPEHACLVRPLELVTVADTGVVVYPHVRGQSLERVLAEGIPRLARVKPLAAMLLDLVDAVRHAHRAGLVHGELSAGAVLLAVEGPHLVLPGLVEPEAARMDAGAARTADVQGLFGILERLAEGLGGAVPAQAATGLAEARAAADDDSFAGLDRLAAWIASAGGIA